MIAEWLLDPLSKEQRRFILELIDRRHDQNFGCLGAEALYLLGGQLVQPVHELGVALGEHGLPDVQHGAPLLPGRCRRRWHQVHDAALPRGAGEDFLDGALEPLMGVAGDADDAVDPVVSRKLV